MYEIWSLGHKPYEGYTNQQVSLAQTNAGIYPCKMLCNVVFITDTIIDTESSGEGRASCSTSWVPQISLHPHDTLLVITV